MSKLAILGFVVILLMLASGHVLNGSMCLGSVGCVGANDNGIRLHSVQP